MKLLLCKIIKLVYLFENILWLKWILFVELIFNKFRIVGFILICLVGFEIVWFFVCLGIWIYKGVCCKFKVLNFVIWFFFKNCVIVWLCFLEIL